MDIAIDATKFHERLRRLRDHWQEHLEDKWGNCGAICIPMGSASETEVYSKSSALHLFLMGYEFPESIILITKSTFCLMAAQKKCNYLQDLIATSDPGNLKVALLPKSKDELQNREHFHSLIQVVKDSGKKIGTLTKASFNGEFVSSWSAFLESNRIESVEIGAALGHFLSVKLDSEMVGHRVVPKTTFLSNIYCLQELCKRAAVLSNKVLKNVFIAEMEDTIDKDLKISHLDFASKV